MRNMSRIILSEAEERALLEVLNALCISPPELDQLHEILRKKHKCTLNLPYPVTVEEALKRAQEKRERYIRAMKHLTKAKK